MTAPTVINRGEQTALTALVRQAHQLGIDVPKHVDQEIELHDRLTRQDPLSTQRELQLAHRAVQSADVGKIDAALDKLTEASLRTLAAQGLADTLNGVALSRLRGAVLGELDRFEAAAVSKFNTAVERHSLNDAARDLPDLTQVVSPVDLSPHQSQAVHVWREGVSELHPIFAFYQKIATINGHIVGPEGSDGLSTNLELACRLGHPGRFSVAMDAAVKAASIAVGSDAARRYGNLAPFVIPAMCGYALHLSTSDGAAAIRRQIQPAA